jgi:hypothetical protein
MAGEAEKSCPISNVLNATITLEAKLIQCVRKTELADDPPTPA